jgi:hypothetical protein
VDWAAEMPPQRLFENDSAEAGNSEEPMGCCENVRAPLRARRHAASFRRKSTTLDGEAVVCGPDGVAIFDALHRRGTVTEAMLYAFDLLEPTVRICAQSRFATVRSAWPGSWRAGIVLGASLFQQACRMPSKLHSGEDDKHNSKNKGSPLTGTVRAGRGRSRKSKCDSSHQSTKAVGGRYFFASASRTFSMKFFSDLATMSVNALASMQVSHRGSTGSAASKGRSRFW